MKPEATSGSPQFTKKQTGMRTSAVAHEAPVEATEPRGRGALLEAVDSPGRHPEFEGAS
jgi:hypothetical protein